MTETTGFRLIPDDVLFFRDGKPSSIGSDHFLRSLFPPYPSTLYGALRTRRLVDFDVSLRGLSEDRWGRLDEELVDEIGKWGKFGSLRLRGPWLVVDEGPRILLPAPQDLAVVLDEHGKPEEVLRHYPDDLPGGGSHPLRPLVSSDPSDPEKAQDAESARGWYLTPEGFAAWSAGGVPAKEHLVHHEDLWHDELRTGIGMETDKRRTSEGLLYTFGFIRLERGVTLGFDVSGTELEPEGAVRLGGERKTARLEPGPALPSFSGSGDSGSLVTLTLVTPAVSETGAYPAGFGPDRLEGKLAGRRVRLVAAAVGGSLPLGGWDMANHRPKPLRRGLPPGSVFYFEPLGGASPADLARELHGSNLTDDFDQHLKLQGFGLALAGLGRASST